MKKIYFILVISFIMSSCVPSFDNAQRLYIKEIKTPDLHIEWFYYSLIGNTTPDYLIMSRARSIDTICIAQNIEEVYLKHDTINIIFDGAPQKYQEYVCLPDKIDRYVIEIQTNATESHALVRKTYTKEDDL